MLGVESLPLRKCGLKLSVATQFGAELSVTSLAEVWIEIGTAFAKIHMMWVTSLAEVWIEIASVSLSSVSAFVTSLAEVWIEIL